DGATCRKARTSPDLVTDGGSFSALLYGGVRPSALVAAQRMTARSAAALARADLFFPSTPPPHCHTAY
ncbi:MAG TPA: sterol carrier protein domain-containing protein, partial [Ilumatobacteraceae bacterium]|nr:sterol carrier protein domain-containing protein [Ilumatobacteraceae bacterium]